MYSFVLTSLWLAGLIAADRRRVELKLTDIIDNMDALNQAQKDGVVLGLKGVAGVAPRMDIDKLLHDLPDTFNLFCLALIDLMNDTDSTKIMGYYQIAGIHGLPKSLWDGIFAQNETPKNRNYSGYCVHGQQEFPTWHRPYLAMIEQTIYKRMADLAEEFPSANKQTYRDAVKEFRLPYWDYYRPRGKAVTFPGVVNSCTTTAKYDFSVPQIFTMEKIMLKTTAKNQLEMKDNPLHLFNFPKLGGIPADQWTIISSAFSHIQTQRYPGARNALTSLNDAVNKAREPCTNLILDMISDAAYDSYDAFAYQHSSPGPSGLLESIHGRYHVLVGGQGGRMSSVPVAAFDPMFWLHHCQIDRWFAIWQAVHPNSWFSDDQDNLLPFRTGKNPTKFWTSRGSKSTQDFGYTYPDLVGNAAQVEAAFKNHYAWSVRTASHPTFGTPPANMAPLDLSQAQVFQYTSATSVSDRAVNLMAAAVPDSLQQPLKIAEKVAVSATSAAKETMPSAVKEAPSAKKEGPENPSQKKKLAKERVFKNLHEAQKPLVAAPDVEESAVSREWFVDDIVERLALDGSFTIYFFIGDAPPSNIATIDYLSYPTLAGANHIFAAPTGACDNCGNQQRQAHLVTDTAPITPILLDYVQVGQLADLTVRNVRPFLIKNLKWKIVTTNGITVDPRDLSSLKIGISSKLTPTDGGDVKYQEFPDIVEEIIENAS